MQNNNKNIATLEQRCEELIKNWYELRFRTSRSNEIVGWKMRHSSINNNSVVLSIKCRSKCKSLPFVGIILQTACSGRSVAQHTPIILLFKKQTLFDRNHPPVACTLRQIHLLWKAWLEFDCELMISGHNFLTNQTKIDSLFEL